MRGHYVVRFPGQHHTLSVGDKAIVVMRVQVCRIVGMYVCGGVLISGYLEKLYLSLFKRL